jgi:hypothetical protein
MALYPEKFASISRSAAPVGWWLIGVCSLIFATVVLGGVTRLTDSGLSIVDWRPLSGILPPLDDATWMAMFDSYRAYPEYQKVNAGMTLAEFKVIFWYEYAHRLPGAVSVLCVHRSDRAADGAAHGASIRFGRGARPAGLVHGAKRLGR